MGNHNLFKSINMSLKSKNPVDIDILGFIKDDSNKLYKEVVELIQGDMIRLENKFDQHAKRLPKSSSSKFEISPISNNKFSIGHSNSVKKIDVLNRRLQSNYMCRNEFNDWYSTLKTAEIQLENHKNRIINMEVMIKLEPNAWRDHNAYVASLIKNTTGKFTSVRAEIDFFSKKRKLSQNSFSIDTTLIESDWHKLLHKNTDLDYLLRKDSFLGIKDQLYSD